MLTGKATIIVLATNLACTAHYRSPGVAADERSSTVGVEELALVGPQASLMEALEKLRPALLSPRRGNHLLVSINEAPPEDLGALRGIPADVVREVKLVRVSRDLVRQKQWADIGTDYVILVWTKQPNRIGQ